MTHTGEALTERGTINQAPSQAGEFAKGFGCGVLLFLIALVGFFLWLGWALRDCC